MTSSSIDTEGRIAVVAIAGRFPGAPTPEALWHAVVNKQELVRDYTNGELERAGVDPRELADPSYVKRGSFLGDADLFDASFFGYAPREAIRLDPQQRWFL